jgi:chorismate-pyruvate lyase
MRCWPFAASGRRLERAPRSASLRQAQWQPHVLALNPPPAYVPWLTEDGSLTARLKAHSDSFRVQCLHQRTAMPERRSGRDRHASAAASGKGKCC